MSDTQTAASAAEHKPLFPAEAISLKSLGYGLNLRLFAGEGNRLTQQTYKAYLGYLSMLFIMSILFFGVWLALLFILGAHEIVFIFTGMVVLCVDLILSVNGIRATVYRFHDLGWSGWWFLVVVVIALIIDGLLVAVLNPTGFAFELGGGLFFALLVLMPFVLKGEVSENKFGSPVDFDWKSFPGEMRFFGHLMFALAILGVLVGSFGLVMAFL